MKRTFWLVALAFCLLVVAFAFQSATSPIAAQTTAAPATTDAACDALKKLKLPGTTITETQFIINLPT